jgi:hypothetical protein
MVTRYSCLSSAEQIVCLAPLNTLLAFPFPFFLFQGVHHIGLFLLLQVLGLSDEGTLLAGSGGGASEARASRALGLTNPNQVSQGIADQLCISHGPYVRAGWLGQCGVADHGMEEGGGQVPWV